MAKFDNRILTPNQGFIQSKIEKTIVTTIKNCNISLVKQENLPGFQICSYNNFIYVLSLFYRDMNRHPRNSFNYKNSMPRYIY